MPSSVGIIVDGPGDFASLKTRLTTGYRILKTDAPRGHTVTFLELARRTRKQIEILKAFHCSRIIVVTDFEQRPTPYDEFVAQLQQAFDGLGYHDYVQVIMPNQMIENWYLADIAHLSTRKAFLRKKLPTKNFEGTNGKKELRQCMVSGTSYSETKHGPAMFAELRFEHARARSRSLAAFLDALPANTAGPSPAG